MTEEVQFPAGAKRFSSLKHPEERWGLPTLLVSGYPEL